MSPPGPAGGLFLGAPWLLVAGALAVAAIVLLHMVRPRPRTEAVSSLLLWRLLQERLREERLLRRLVTSLPLWLQIAAALLLGLALARPGWRGSGEAGGVGVFVVDRSASMQAREAGTDRFALARAELARVLREQRLGELRRIYVGGVGPEGAQLSGPFSSPARAAQALAEVAPPADGPADFDALERALAALAASGQRLRIWLATDGVMGPEARAALQDLGRRARLEVVPVGRPDAPNVAVTALQAYRVGPGPGDVEVMAEVANFSASPVEASLRLRGDFGLDRSWPLLLQPGARTRVVVPYRVLGPAALRARLDLPAPDALALDDERALAFSDPSEPAVVYLVGGEPAPPIRRALEAAGPVRVMWVPAASVRSPRSAWMQLPELPGPGEGAMEAGAHLVVFDGVRPPLASEPAASGGAWAAPVWWVLPPAAGAGPADEPVVHWKRTHPLLRFVELQGVRVRRSPWADLPPPDAEVLVEGSSGPLLWERLDSTGRHVFEMAFALEDSNLPGRVAFAVLVSNVLRMAAPHVWDPAQPPRAAGQGVTIRVPPGEREILVLTPDGGVVQLPGQGRASVVFTDTGRAGVYSAWPASGRSDTPLALWAVQPPGPEESDLRLTGRIPASLAEAKGEGAPGPTPRPLWPFVVAAGLAAMAGEAVVYLLTTRFPRGPALRLAHPGGGPPQAPGGWARRRRTFLILRSAAVAALAAALLNPSLPWPSGGRRLVFVVDASLSVPAPAREQATRFVEEVVAKLGPQDRAWVVESGARPRLLASYRGPHPDPDAPAPPMVGSTGDATDLEAALRAALSLLGAAGDARDGQAPGAAPGRVVLISDGRETSGHVLALRPPVPVDVVPVLARPAPEVAMGAVVAPPAVPAGSPVPLRVSVHASEAQPARLALDRDGVPLWEGSVQLSAGWNTFTFQDPSPPGGSMAVYTARIRPPLDTHEANNRAGTVVGIAGRPRVLYVSAGADAPGADALADAGLTVDRVAPEGLPASRAELSRFSAVVLDDVAATRLTQPQMETLAAAVRDLGIGLVTVGGPHAFGPGGYLDTPLEEVLPVWARVPARLLIPQVALVLIIDKSGSMGEQDATGSKLDAARRAAAATLELLAPGDLVGVLAFDVQPHWVQPLGPASDPVGLMRRMAHLAADGGTDLGPALQEALESLRRVRAMVRHAIVLSDGKSNPADFEAMTRRAAAEGITVSTVAIGPDADAALLAAIARWGRGRFYLTRDLRTIPQIFASETITVTRSAIVQGPVEVVATGNEGAGEGLLPARQRTWPRLSGYVATTPKGAASVYLASPEGDPILAAWRVGLGRAVAFTSSLTGPWGEEWRRSGLASSLLQRMVRWAMTPAGAGAGASRLYVELEGDRARLVAELLDGQGRPLNFLEARATVSGPSGRVAEVPLVQEAPGRYAGALEAPEPGEYVATADVGGVRLRAVAVRPYPAELEPGPPSPTVLAALARTTGGQVLGYITASSQDPAPGPDLPPELAQAAARLAASPPAQAGAWPARPAWPLLVGLAMALLLADVAVRQWTEPPHRLLADLRVALAARVEALTRRLGRWRHPSPDEVLAARRTALAARRRPTATSRDAGVDPSRAARLYLARLQRERRPR